MAADQRQRQTIRSVADEIFAGTSPLIGNPDGDVVLVEFFDYNCGYCKRMLEPMQRLVEEDSGLKVVMKEFPILAESSMSPPARRWRRASRGSITAYHNALMGHRGALTRGHLRPRRGGRAWTSSSCAPTWARRPWPPRSPPTSTWPARWGVRGTPAFVIGDDLIPGAVGYDALRQAIETERAG